MCGPRKVRESCNDVIVCSLQEAHAIIHQVGREGGDKKLYRARCETMSLRK